MSGSISPLGWIIIIVLAIFIVTLNVTLFTSMRKKPGKQTWVDHLRKANDSLRDPWKNENQKFEELSQITERLKDRKDTGEKKE